MWDWRHPIDDIRDEVRKARSNGEQSTTLDSVDKLLDNLRSIYESLEADEKKYDDENFKKFVQQQKDVLSKSYEHAKQYSNVIVFGGYAGLFTLWNFTKPTLSHWQVTAVGLCILISLIIYIAFELYGAWLRTTQVNNQVRELAAAEKLNKFPEEYGKAEMLRTNKFMKIWPYFFFSAIGFAALAALILISAFVSVLICGNA